MNPADAFRKEQRKKEVQRNKMERKFMREAAAQRSNPDEIKKQLQEIIDLEEAGPLAKTLKLKKKALQEAYDAALKKRKASTLRCCTTCIRAGPGPLDYSGAGSGGLGGCDGEGWGCLTAGWQEPAGTGVGSTCGDAAQTCTLWSPTQQAGLTTWHEDPAGAGDPHARVGCRRGSPSVSCCVACLPVHLPAYMPACRRRTGERKRGTWPRWAPRGCQSSLRTPATTTPP